MTTPDNTTPAPVITPAAHQIWADNDKRSRGRYVRILQTDDAHATVVQTAYNETDHVAADLPGARITRIRLDRLRPTSTGYRPLLFADGTPMEAFLHHTPTSTTTTGSSGAQNPTHQHRTDQETNKPCL